MCSRPRPTRTAIYAEYNEFLEQHAKEYSRPAPVQYDMLLPLTFSCRIAIAKGKELVSGGISLLRSDVVLVRGVSGAGKTTFFREFAGSVAGEVGIALHSKPPGVTMENFSSAVATYKQNTQLPTGDVTYEILFGSVPPTHEVFQLACIESKAKELASEPTRVFGLNVSGGERTRLYIAYRLLTLTQQTEVLIMDEPEQGLDADCAYAVINNIAAMCRKRGIMFMFASHLELADTRIPCITKTLLFENYTITCSNSNK